MKTYSLLHDSMMRLNFSKELENEDLFMGTFHEVRYDGKTTWLPEPVINFILRQLRRCQKENSKLSVQFSNKLRDHHRVDYTEGVRKVLRKHFLIDNEDTCSHMYVRMVCYNELIKT